VYVKIIIAINKVCAKIIATKEIGWLETKKILLIKIEIEGVRNLIQEVV